MVNIDSSFAPELGFLAVFLSWFLAQMIKVVRGVVREKHFDVRWVFNTGGMPSSHTSSVASLATVVGLYFGFRSIAFLFSLVFCIITMFDAAGVRRSVGKQAKALNTILDEFYEKGQVPETQLKELLGHTPFEVIAGTFLGVLTTILLCG